MINVIVAMSKNGVIGNQGTIPWSLPEDMKRFKRLTMGHTVLMGRKTFESLGSPLEGRRNVVLSKDPEYKPSGVEVFRGFSEAVRTINPTPTNPLWVIGGEQIYRWALATGEVDSVFLTLVEIDAIGDTYFPVEYVKNQYKMVQQIKYSTHTDRLYFRA